MTLRRPSHFLFDFDGTLVDSSSLHDRAFRRVLSEYDPRLLAGFDYEAVKGKSTREALLTLGIPDPEPLSRLTGEKQRLYRAAVEGGQLESIAGAGELLTSLRDGGHRLFLITSGSRDSVLMSLRATNLHHWFEGVITAEDVQHAKPAPDAFLLCLNRYGLSPDRAVVVEDAPSGVAAARAAGLSVIGVNNPAVLELADLFFATLGEFKDWSEAQGHERELVA